MTETITIDPYLSVTIAFVVFFLGAFLTRHIRFLRVYNIPEPVAGGLAVAVGTWVIYRYFDRQIEFDLEVRDLLLVMFFATIGLNARIADLVAGGRMLGILLVLTVGYIIIQNTIGLIGTEIFDLPAAVSVLVGSASLIGGHGTAIAWGPTVAEATGFAAANEIGIAAATLGLVCAALLGGPIAQYLINRDNLVSTVEDGDIVGVAYDLDEDQPDTHEDDDVDNVSLMRALLAIHIAIIIGYIANEQIEAMGLKLPLFVPCLLAGILMSNTIPYLFPKMPWPARTKALAIISDYSLSVFLAMSLMSMQLWTLAGLGGPLLGILALQVVITALFILLIVYRAMGRNYTAAVLSAGFAGFSLGATPTAIANMSAVTKTYGPAPLAFIILPLVSAFFVDLANAFIIRFFVGL